MTWRRQLTVASPISISAVGRSAFESVFARHSLPDKARETIRTHFGARAVVTTDSGTSALVLALQLAVPRGGVVGFPGYACVDLAAAALYAGVRVRLYDLVPDTLGPDLASVERLLGRGVDALVVAHLFGYPADVPGMRTLAARAGVPLIEDAAQAAGGMLDKRPAGSLGDLSILSFGRGKGLNAGGGGALLGFGPEWEDALARTHLGTPRRGLAGLLKTAVQWGLGRPSFYAIPSMIPGLHLGEMVYHPAHQPESLSLASSSLLSSALALAPHALAGRRDRAHTLETAASTAPLLGMTRAAQGTEPGYLRYPVRDVGGKRNPAPSIGIVRSYPQTLAEQPQLLPILISGESDIPGAAELRRTLFTLPTHRFVSESDMARMVTWLQHNQ